MEGPSGSLDSDLARRAAEVLRHNDMGGWTRASPELYPHQWSWDTGFIAIGLAHLDTERAAEELRTLFDHQWKNGKVPHIVFNPEAPPESYFPGAEHWISAGEFADAPAADPRPRRPAHLGDSQGEGGRGQRAGISLRDLPQAACLASLPA